MARHHFLFPLALCAITLSSPGHAGPRQVANASVTVLQKVSAQITTNLSAGTVKTVGQANQGGNTNPSTSGPTGTIAVPATYPLNAQPQPVYSSTMAKQGSGASAPTSARIDLTGAPNATFSLVVQGWTQTSGLAGAGILAGSTTFYSPSSSPDNVARGAFDGQGKAAIYIGATIAIPRDPSGSAYSFKPLFVTSYN